MNKRYGAFQALTDINGEVAKGQVIVLCGPSGSGKSTLLRTVNRLERISSGRVTVNGVDINARDTPLQAMRLRIGFVFQQYNLFPHLTAFDNIVIGLTKSAGMPEAEARSRAARLLERVNLTARAGNYPSRLSGGEQQRIAIIRALAFEPEIMLFDEPTSALDAEMVGEVLSLIRELADTGMTMMCATHEMNFAREVADRIWFMERGKIVVDVPPSEFFGGTGNERVERFLGNFL
ncbi:amino acid ABC transporter ATP-binding protein [Tropicimonas sp. IMCC34043]|uniref:amino acid ABC transporter ATP-binding protein n=1 Tax=Tropicimonas sp. IMCC34043 TaxID=2248760 RepID=UPI001E53E11C|nr:amino acid ABC transporter ATP-binding protein [Tropicimonas sp. IMCC34043]